MRIEDDIKLDFDDVLIRPKRSVLSSRNDVDLERPFTFKHSRLGWKGIPIMASNMDTVGTFEVAEVLEGHKIMTVIHKFYDESDWQNFYEKNKNSFLLKNKRFYYSYSIGANKEDLIKFKKVQDLIAYGIDFLCIDVANGYSEYFKDFVRFVRKEFPNLTIIAGNVVTAEMTEQLILSGADIVKVGIGPGSACTTRIKTGVGYPQLSAIIECADASHGLNGHIIADGGCKTPGDIAKAFGAGADFVMLGGMLAGHDENPGEVITKKVKTNEIIPSVGVMGNSSNSCVPGYNYVKDNQLIVHKKYKPFYGMSSKKAQETHYGEVKEYRASEGRNLLVPYKGSIENTIQNILGGLRSTCTYVGAKELKHLSKCTTFIRVNTTHNKIFESYDKENN